MPSQYANAWRRTINSTCSSEKTYGSSVRHCRGAPSRVRTFPGGHSEYHTFRTLKVGARSNLKSESTPRTSSVLVTYLHKLYLSVTSPEAQGRFSEMANLFDDQADREDAQHANTRKDIRELKDLVAPPSDGTPEGELREVMNQKRQLATRAHTLKEQIRNNKTKS